MIETQVSSQRPWNAAWGRFTSLKRKVRQTECQWRR